MISKEQYINYKRLVDEFELEQKRLSKFIGKSTCPFCSGSKIKPFVSAYRNQNCTDCDSNGEISNSLLASLDLEWCIQKQI